MFHAEIVQSNKKRDKSLTDIGNFKYVYKLPDDVTMDGFHLNSLHNFRSAILDSSTYERLNPKYYMKPDYFCHDKYGVKEFWFVILYINNLFDRSEFKLEQIHVPSSGILNQLVSKGIPFKDRLITVST